MGLLQSVNGIDVGFYDTYLALALFSYSCRATSSAVLQGYEAYVYMLILNCVGEGVS